MSKFILTYQRILDPQNPQLRDREERLTLNGDQGCPEDLFERVLKAEGIAREEVTSFWRVGKAYSVTSQSTFDQSVTMWDRDQGEQLIFQMRNLPTISRDAAYTLTRNIPAARDLAFSKRALALHPEAALVMEELVDSGLIEDLSDDESYRFRRTREGQTYPADLLLDWKFMPIWRIAIAPEHVEPLSLLRDADTEPDF